MVVIFSDYPYNGALIIDGEGVSGIMEDRFMRYNNFGLPFSSIFYLFKGKKTEYDRVSNYIYVGLEPDYASKCLREILNISGINLDLKTVHIIPDIGHAFYLSYKFKEGISFCFYDNLISAIKFKDNKLLRMDIGLDESESLKKFLMHIHKYMNGDSELIYALSAKGKLEKYKYLRECLIFDPNGRVYVKKSPDICINDENIFDWGIAVRKITEDIFLHLINYIKYIGGDLKVFVNTNFEYLLDKKILKIIPSGINFNNLQYVSHLIGTELYYKYVKKNQVSEEDRQRLINITNSIFNSIRKHTTDFLKKYFKNDLDPVKLAIEEAFLRSKELDISFKIEDILIDDSGILAWVSFGFFLFGKQENGHPYIVNHKGIIYFKRDEDNWNVKDIEFTIYDNKPVLTMELTNLCNFKCIMCDQSTKSKLKNRPMGYMKQDTFKRIIENLKDFPVSTITPFWVGESTLHPDFSELVKYLFDKNINNKLFINFTLNTNGSLLDEKNIDILLKVASLKNMNPMTFLRIHFSLDAFLRETFYKVHKADRYDITINNIILFLKKRKEMNLSYPKVTIAFIIMDENKKEAKNFLEFWKDVLRKYSNNFAITYDWPAYDKDAIYFRRLDSDNQKEAEELHKKVLIELGLISEEVKEKRIINTDSILKEDSTKKKTFVRRPCPGLWLTPIINWNGDVTVCCFDIDMKLKIGNINEKSLSEIWNSPKIDYWRLCHIRGDFHRIPVCHNCANLNAPTMKNADFIEYMLKKGLKNEIKPFLERVGAGI